MENPTNIRSRKTDDDDDVMSFDDVVMQPIDDVINTPVKKRNTSDVGGGVATPVTSIAMKFNRTNLASGGDKTNRFSAMFLEHKKQQKRDGHSDFKKLLGFGTNSNKPADNENVKMSPIEYNDDLGDLSPMPKKQQKLFSGQQDDTPVVAGKIRRCTTLVEGTPRQLYNRTALFNDDDEEDDEVAGLNQNHQENHPAFQRYGSTSTGLMLQDSETQIKQYSGTTKRKIITQQQPQTQKRQQAIRPDTAPGMMIREIPGVDMLDYKLPLINENVLTAQLEEEEKKELANFDIVAGGDRHVRNLVAPVPSTPTPKVQEVALGRMLFTSKENNEAPNFDDGEEVDNGASPIFAGKMGSGNKMAVLGKSPGSKWHRSATDTASMQLVFDGGLTGGYPVTPQLPLLEDSTSEMNYISDETLVTVLSGVLAAKYELVDCRFPYEYEGGHIKGALNGWTYDNVMNRYFGKNPLWATTAVGEPPVVVIFYCEFSSKRAPTMYRSMRAYDRSQNQYPHMHYPEMYVLKGGYKNFYAVEDKATNTLHPKLHNLKWCHTPTYRPMDHADFREELHACEKERKNKSMKKGKRAGKPKLDMTGKRSRLAM